MKTKISIIPVFGDKGMNVEKIQQKLAELGFSLGNIDGDFGKQTQKAIAEFQSSQGLTNDGVLNDETLSRLELEEETELDSNPVNAVLSIVDRSRISKTRWENGNRGQAPYGYYYGMGLMFANLYERLKKEDNIAKELSKPLTGSENKDALTKCNDALVLVLGNSNSETDRLRHLFVLMFGLGLMESNGKYCCGWDRGKETGWGNPDKIIAPTSTNSEAGLFQTSYDIINSVSSSTKELLRDIFRKYKISDDGFLEYFSKGAKCSERNSENFGDGEGKEFQALSKECPGFTVEFTAVALRNVSNHWNPVIRIGNPEKGLQIKKECDDLLLKIQNYIDDNEEAKSFVDAVEERDSSDNLKEGALALAEPRGQKEQLQKLFNYDPNSKANYWAVVDFNKSRSEKRLFIFDLKNKNVEEYLVSHGVNSGQEYAVDFSNTERSKQSSLGIFKTGTTYIGKNGRSLYLDGLESSNSNARKRHIVLHQGVYVTDQRAGNSEGCFVVNPKYAQKVIDNLRDGSYIIAWHS